MKCQAIRGAITVEENTEEAILEATVFLLNQIISKNNLVEEDIVSMFFTATTDINATFPAKAARHLGFVNTPLMCGQEIEVPGALAQCIRLIMHVNTQKSKLELKHIYERNAKILRPDHQHSE